MTENLLYQVGLKHISKNFIKIILIIILIKFLEIKIFS